jgi:hypothetical protein
MLTATGLPMFITGNTALVNGGAAVVSSSPVVPNRTSRPPCR